MYVDAWRSLRNDLAAALGGEPSGFGWDPDVTVRLGGVDVIFQAGAALAVLRHLDGPPSEQRARALLEEMGP